MRTRIHTALIALLSIGLLALFLRHADLGEVWASITRARLELLLLTMASMAFNLVVRAVRWQYLLKPIGATRFRNAFRATTIGFAATFLLPARAGEFLRPYLMAKKENLSVTTTFATVVLERLIDVMTVLILFGAFVLVFDPGLDRVNTAAYRAVKLGGLFAAAAAVSGLAVMLFLSSRPEAIGHVMLRVESFLPQPVAHTLSRLAQLFVEGLAAARQPRRLAVALLYSLPLWLSVAFGVWSTSHAFEIDVPYTGTFLLVALLSVGVAVPTPGAVGGFHEAFRLGVTTFYGAPNDRAVGAGIVLHALSFIPVTLLGIFFTTQDGLTLSRMRSLAGRRAKGDADEVPLLRSSGR